MIELIGGPLYQWDIGRTVSEFKGNAVQFANKGDSVALTVTPEDAGELRIPDRFLTTGKPLVVYDVEIGADDEITTLSTKVFPVLARPKPKDYTPTKAEEAYGVVKKLSEEAKNAAQAASEAADTAKNLAEDAAGYAQDAFSSSKEAAAAAEDARALIVTEDSGENASSSYWNVMEAALIGRNVFFKPYGQGNKVIPLLAVDDQGEVALFANVLPENQVLTVYAIWDDATVSKYSIQIPRIDDTKVGADAWSSKNTVDKLCPVFEKSGILVQCEPVEGYPLTIDTQESPGTITVCGKNLYDANTYPMTANQILRHSSGNIQWSAVFAATLDHIPVAHLRGEKISIRNAPAVTNGENTGAGIAFYDHEKVYISGTNKAQVTVPSDASFMRFSINMNYATEAQIEIGDVVTDYEAYNGTEFPEAVEVEVPAKGGVNNIFAFLDGDYNETITVNVSGRANPAALIDKLTQAVISLGGNI